MIHDEKFYKDLINALHILQSYMASGGEQYGTMNLDNELRIFQAQLQKKVPRDGIRVDVTAPAPAIALTRLGLIGYTCFIGSNLCHTEGRNHYEPNICQCR